MFQLFCTLFALEKAAVIMAAPLLALGITDAVSVSRNFKVFLSNLTLSHHCELRVQQCECIENCTQEN